MENVAWDEERDEERFGNAYLALKKQFKRKYTVEGRGAFSTAWVLYYRYFLQGERSASLLESMQALIETTGGKVRQKKVVTCPHCGKGIL